MKVTEEQCRVPACRGCGRHVGYDHAEHCLLLERPDYYAKRKNVGDKA